jgi:hypothetical protein
MANPIRAVGACALVLLMSAGGQAALANQSLDDHDYDHDHTQCPLVEATGTYTTGTNTTTANTRIPQTTTSSFQWQSAQSKANARVQQRSVMQNLTLTPAPQSQSQPRGLQLSRLNAQSAQSQSNAVPQHSEVNRKGNRNLGHNMGANHIHALILTNRHIVYDRDPLEISIRFPRGAELIAAGEVDAYLLIFQPDAETVVVPVSGDVSENRRRLFRIDSMDVRQLPPGVYQLGLVITVPGGNPLLVADWYNGLRGMLAIRGMTVSNEALAIDRDGDGMIDGDEGGDGFGDTPADEGSQQDEAEQETVQETEQDEAEQDEAEQDEAEQNEAPSDE